MNRQQFLTTVVTLTARALPAEVANVQVRHKGHLVKLYFANERVHYEVWPDQGRQKLEIGLHFEDGPVSTAAYLAFFDGRIIELKHLLGPKLELERWTGSWGHLFIEHPWQPPDATFAQSVAAALTQMMTIVEPMVQTAAIPREHAIESTKPSNNRRWNRRSAR